MLIFDCVGNFQGNETEIEEYERLVMTLFQQALRQPMTQVNGFKGIHDCKNMSLKMVRLATPRRMYKLVQVFTVNKIPLLKPIL